MTDTELLQALVRAQERTNELLEQIARQTAAGVNPATGYSADFAKILLGGPEELARQNKARAAAERRARKQQRGGQP